MAGVQMSQDDKKLIQQIRASHSPDANIDVDEKAFLSLAEAILHTITSHGGTGPTEDKGLLKVIPEALALTMHKIGCELSCNCSGMGDTKAITQEVFNSLVKYTWDAKVVLVFSAFAATYGEFHLLFQQPDSNLLAKYVFTLKPLPDISERETLIMDFLKVVIEVATSIIRLVEISVEDISHDKPPLSEALELMPNAVYWAIKGIVICASQSIGLINISRQYMISIAETRKILMDLTQTLTSINFQLKRQINECEKYLEDKRTNQHFHQLVKVFESSHKDIEEVFVSIFQTKESLPLFNGVTKKRVSFTELKGKRVVLFISYAHISDDDIQLVVKQVNKGKSPFEIVWLPLTDKQTISSSEIIRKAGLMPWYSLHPSVVVHVALMKYIKEVWHFEMKPLMVEFSTKGTIVNLDIYDTLMTFGEAPPSPPIVNPGTSKDIPPGSGSENGSSSCNTSSQWENAKWCLDFLFDGVVVEKEQWIKEGKLVCFYGGEDIDWIRKFTTAMREIIKGEGIILELIYVGKKHTGTVIKENLGKALDVKVIKKFRSRMQCIMFSKIKHAHSIASDKIFKEILTLISAFDSQREWALIGHGSNDVVVMNGKQIELFLHHIKTQKITITIQNFFTTMESVLTKPPEVENGNVGMHCNHIELPTTNGVTPEKMVCVDCNRPMEKYIVYKCCIE